MATLLPLAVLYYLCDYVSKTMKILNKQKTTSVVKKKDLGLHMIWVRFRCIL